MSVPASLFRLALLLLVAEIPHLPARAADEKPVPPKLRFLFLDESPGHYSLPLGNDRHRQLSSGPYEISAPYTPSDLRPFDVFKNLPDPATGVPARVRIARISPPTNTDSALVVITPRPPPDSLTPPEYLVEFIDSNPAAFPPGTIRIINRGTVAMAAQFSDSRIVTEPGKINLIRPVTDNRHRTLYKIAIQIQQDAGEWQLIQDSITVLRPAERMIGILVYSPGGMRHTLTPAEIAETGPPRPSHYWLAYSEQP